MLSQMTLVSDICKAVEKQGFKNVTVKQLNAIISGATLIVEKFHEPHIPAVPGMGFRAWIETDDVGSSSKYMAAVGRGMPDSEVVSYPRDGADFGRCYKLLRATPEIIWVLAMPKIAEHGGPVWKLLVENWTELERRYLADLTSKTDTCTEKIREIVDAAQKIVDTKRDSR